MKRPLSFRAVNAEEVFRQLKDRAGALIAETGAGLYESAANATPVRSGRARANWRCSIGNPVYESDENTQFDSSRARSAFQGAKAGDILYLTNSVPYIERLENGYSLQAPSGIKDQAVSACRTNFESGRYLHD